MDAYEKREDYLLSYKIEDGKLIENYYGDNVSIVPYTEHNKSILDRTLEKQWKRKINSISYQNLKDYEKNIKICNKIFIICGVLDYMIKQNNIISYINFAAFLGTSVIIYKLNKNLKRIKLTEFCMNNIDKVNEVMQDEEARKFISGTESKTFNLNNQHEFTTSDLKFIKTLVKVNNLK